MMMMNNRWLKALLRLDGEEPANATTYHSSN